MAQQPLSEADAAFVWDTLREPVYQDRAFQGFRFATIYEKSQSNVDEMAGTYDESLVVLHDNVPISLKHYPAEVIANSDGLIQERDNRMIFYDIGALDTKTTLIKTETNGTIEWWRIIGQDHHAYSGKSDLQVRPAATGELS